MIHDPLSPDIGAPAPGAVVAVNTPVAFMGSDDTYPTATLTWTFGDGGTGSGTNPSHTYAATGAYTIKLTSSKTGLASKSVSETITVTAGPTTAPTITAFRAAADAVAPGGTDTLTWAVSGASSLSVDHGVGTVTGSSQAVAPSGTTTYTLTATNAVGSTTAQVTVIVDPLLTALTWKRDILYLGGKEVAEYDANGMHVTHEDHLGSPRFITNAAGVVESRQKYLPFGETLDAALPGTYAPGKGFTNHEQTDPSGAIYMQARYYLPQWHRFTAPDPARDQHFEETQSWNIYSYVQNDPTMRIDPTGEVATIIVNGNTLKIMLPVRFGKGTPQAYKDQFIKSVESAWTGNFGKYKVTTQVVQGAVDGRTNDVFVYRQAGRSQADTGAVHGDAYVFTGETPEQAKQAEPAQTDSHVGKVMAHEAGHLMGLDDGYTDGRSADGKQVVAVPKDNKDQSGAAPDAKGKRSEKDIMVNEKKGRPTESDIHEMLVNEKRANVVVRQ